MAESAVLRALAKKIRPLEKCGAAPPEGTAPIAVVVWTSRPGSIGAGLVPLVVVRLGRGLDLGRTVGVLGGLGAAAHLELPRLGDRLVGCDDLDAVGSRDHVAGPRNGLVENLDFLGIVVGQLGDARLLTDHELRIEVLDALVLEVDGVDLGLAALVIDEAEGDVGLAGRGDGQPALQRGRALVLARGLLQLAEDRHAGPGRAVGELLVEQRLAVAFADDLDRRVARGGAEVGDVCLGDQPVATGDEGDLRVGGELEGLAIDLGLRLTVGDLELGGAVAHVDRVDRSVIGALAGQLGQGHGEHPLTLLLLQLRRIDGVGPVVLGVGVIAMLDLGMAILEMGFQHLVGGAALGRALDADLGEVACRVGELGGVVLDHDGRHLLAVLVDRDRLERSCLGGSGGQDRCTGKPGDMNGGPVHGSFLSFDTPFPLAAALSSEGRRGNEWDGRSCGWFGNMTPAPGHLLGVLCERRWGSSRGYN